MNFNKDNKTSPFCLNSNLNSNSPFSLQATTTEQLNKQEKKSPFTLSTGANMSSLVNSNTGNNNNNNNNNNKSPFSLSSSKPILNSFANKNETTSSPFSLQTSNSKPLLNQTNHNNTKKENFSLFNLQSNVAKPILNNNSSNNNNEIKSGQPFKTTSPFGVKSDNNEENSSPFSLSTNNDKKLISPFSISNSNSNSKSPFTLQTNSTNVINNSSPFNLQNNNNNNNNNTSTPFSLQSNINNNSPFSLTDNKPLTFNNKNLNSSNEKISSPFSLQTNSKPLSSMITDSKIAIFPTQQNNNSNSNNNNNNQEDKVKYSPLSSKESSDNDLTKNNNTLASSIFASFNVPLSTGKKTNKDTNNSLIAKPSSFAKFLLDINDNEEIGTPNNQKKNNSSNISINEIKSPLSPNVLEDIDEDSAEKESIQKLNEIHKLFRNSSPYYLLNFIDWEETEGYDEEEDYVNANESESENSENENNKVKTENETEKSKIHKLFKFDTPSPDDIVIMSREKGKKDMRDTNYRSTSYMEKKNEEESAKATQKSNTSNIEISSDHVIRIGSSNQSKDKDSLTNSKSSSTISLSFDNQNQDSSNQEHVIHPDGFNFNYKHDLLKTCFKPEEEIFETDDEKAESDYYKYQKFENEMDRILCKEYPPIPDPLPAKYNTVYYHKLDIEKEFQKRQSTQYRKSLHITCLGPLKSGKSTLLGRIYEEFILKPTNTLREVKKIEKELQRKKLSLEKKYAWLMDESKMERERDTTLGVTTDFSVNYKDRELVFYDTPGHMDYISTTISELYQTDVILLTINALSENINNECDIAIIKDYLFLCKCIGIKKIIIIINKMEKVKYSEMAYEKLKNKMKKIMEQFKFKESNIKYIPCDGLNGENLFEKSSNPLLSWYNEEYLFEYLDKIEILKNEGETLEKMITKPFIMVVKDYMREGGISGSSVTVEGRICSGAIQIGENLFTTPNYDVPFIRAIECNSQLVKFATTGDYIKIGLGNIDINKIGKDTILSSIEYPIKLVNKFKAQILVNSSNIPIIKGTNATMYINNNQESVYIKKIKMKKVKNPRNNKFGYKRTMIIPKNTTAEVIIQLHDKRRIPLETYANLRHFGRFILQHNTEIIASGVVLELL